jgi:hypothetical protein
MNRPPQLTRLVYSVNGLDEAGIREIAEQHSYEVVKAARERRKTVLEWVKDFLLLLVGILFGHWLK